MRVEPWVFFSNDIDACVRVKGNVYSDTTELKGELANDGVEHYYMRSLDWHTVMYNDSDGSSDLRKRYMSYFYVIKGDF